MKTKKEIKTIVTSKHDELFKIVKSGNGYVIVVGEYQAHKKVFESVKDAEQFIASKPYSLIFNVFQILSEYAQKNKQTKETEKND